MGTNFYNPGDSMEVAVASAGSGETAALYVVVEDLTTSAYDSFGPPQTDSAGWTGNCCVMARMTTIAQSGDNFGDGNLFGPIDWTEEDLDSGSYGTQCYPNNANIIEVSGFSDDPWQETDTIDLSGASGGSCSD
jgi:hypothetical protein